jgi:transposase, IS30 family
MLKEGRPGLTDAQKAELWRRWKAGQSTEEICDALRRCRSAVGWQLSQSGGLVPRIRRRAAVALTFAEREEVSRGLCAGRSLRSIAQGLGRAPSTVSREVARHWGRSGYRANHADYEASVAARRPKPCRLALHAKLCRVVASKLALEWSPEQISAWLKKHHPADESMQVSHETIYKSLFIQARGVLKKELAKHLRTRRPIRRARAKGGREELRGKISGAISIRERPAEVEDRAVPGHWEGDLLCGSHRSQIVTLVERHSRFTTLIKVKDATTESVVDALARHARTLPRKLKRSLTWDQGKEMAGHKNFSVATDVKVYFCDPHSPWQRGTNENTNGLLRQYFPKGTDLSRYTQSQLDKVALRLNQRPRETLGFETPADKLRQSIASTG